MKFEAQINKDYLIKSLLNTKIELTEDQSVKFQNFLFSLDIRWSNGVYEVQYKENPYLYIYDDMILKIGFSKDVFRANPFKLIFYDDYKLYMK